MLFLVWLLLFFIEGLKFFCSKAHGFSVLAGILLSDLDKIISIEVGVSGSSWLWADDVLSPLFLRINREIS